MRMEICPTGPACLWDSDGLLEPAALASSCTPSSPCTWWHSSPLSSGHCALWPVGFGVCRQLWGDAMGFLSHLPVPAPAFPCLVFPFVTLREAAEGSDTSKRGLAQHCILGCTLDWGERLVSKSPAQIHKQGRHPLASILSAHSKGHPPRRCRGHRVAVGWSPGPSPPKIISSVNHPCPASDLPLSTMVHISWMAYPFTGGRMQAHDGENQPTTTPHLGGDQGEVSWALFWV